ncbi:MAG: endo-1,4-beta-xylanase [Oscillospiraceae bacterium]|jgi:GH35 family endo-1,4-beta-xylanase|nr:endo-1,4-beta-xylanase [Oscillospiraceae bacterium]
MIKRIAGIAAAAALLLAAALPGPSYAAVEAMNILSFETGTKQGFVGRGGAEFLSVTSTEAYSGGNSMQVSDRTQTWHGPILNVAYYVVPGELFDVSVWVKSAVPAAFRLGVQTGEGDAAKYYTVAEGEVSGDWTQLAGKIAGEESGMFGIYVECDDPTAEFCLDDVLFRRSASGSLQKSIELPSLSEIYQDMFLIGTAFTPSDLEGDRYELIKRHFNVLTAGNEMKPQSISRAPNAYRYNHIDPAIEKLAADGILLHGHTLVWHSQSADWLNMNANGEVLTRAEAKANMEAYINEVAGHFKGKVISWDVVNEAIATSVGSVPASWKDVMRESDAPWYRAYENGADTAAGESGADYIYDAFVFARLADPGAELCFNDFNEESPGKREAMAMMAEELNAQWESDPRNTEPGRKLIEALGLQAHYNVSGLRTSDVEATIQRFIEAGVDVIVTELDIPGGGWPNYTPIETAEQEKVQATLYAELFQIFKKYGDNISRVTVWGIDDPTSWRSEGDPLLFGEITDAKLAYYAAADPEGFLAGDYDNIRSENAGASTAVEVGAPDMTAAATEPSPAAEAPSPVAEPSPEASPAEGNGGAGTWLGVVAGSVAVAVFFAIRKRKKK